MNKLMRSRSARLTLALVAGSLTVPMLVLAPATSAWASGCGGPVNVNQVQYEMAFQANTTNMILFGTDQDTNTGQGMMPGTNPSITTVAVTNSGCLQEEAFQANIGTLFVFGADQSANTGLGMMPGTSPSITFLTTGGFMVAFQANNGDLYTYSSKTGAANTGLGMNNNTSPSITALTNGGWEVAFQANTGTLWHYGTAGTGDSGLGMKAGTSPSIAETTGSTYKIAFQANTGDLWYAGTAPGAGNTGLGMDNNTSPSITAVPAAGWVVAFQANTGTLWTEGSAPGAVFPVASGDTGLAMMPGTSPAVAFNLQLAGVTYYTVAAQANSGVLWTVRPFNGTNSWSEASTGQGMNNDTSPAITNN